MEHIYDVVIIGGGLAATQRHSTVHAPEWIH